MKSDVIACCSILALSFTALAHGGGQHLKGEVAARDAKTLTVTTAGRDVVVGLDATTRFENDGKPSTLDALPLGARVVVHLKAQSKQPLAAIVKFIAPPAASSTRLEVTVTDEGYVVSNPKPLKAGQPVTLVVTRTAEQTCATDVVLKEFGISRPLPLGKPVEVTFTPSKPGKVHVACAMDMVSTDLKVE